MKQQTYLFSAPVSRSAHRRPKSCKTLFGPNVHVWLVHCSCSSLGGYNDHFPSIIIIQGFIFANHLYKSDFADLVYIYNSHDSCSVCEVQYNKHQWYHCYYHNTAINIENVLRSSLDISDFTKYQASNHLVKASDVVSLFSFYLFIV